MPRFVFLFSYVSVVSIGAFLTFYVVFAPLEYIPNIVETTHSRPPGKPLPCPQK